jgi:uncharacterized membrane protein YdjX (TVP38/TMEM64 family)
MPPPGDTPDAAPIELEIEAAQSAFTAEKKFLIMAIVVAAVVVSVHLLHLERYVTDVQRWKSALRSLGIWSSLLYGLASAALIAAGVPRLLFGAIAGMLFGFWEGFAVAQGSALLGSYATFVFARWGGRDWGARRIDKIDRLRELLKNPSVFSVFLVRQLPIAGLVPNVMLGITPVRHRVFVIGSFLGYLPSSAMVALIGSGLGKESLRYSLFLISLAMLVLGTGSMIIWRIRKKLSGVPGRN